MSDDRLGRLRAARILASGDGMNDGPGRHDDERGAAGGAQKQQQGRRRAHGFGCTRVKDTARRWKFVEVPRQEGAFAARKRWISLRPEPKRQRQRRPWLRRSSRSVRLGLTPRIGGLRREL